jgi:DNA-binding response OmpR family regulator
MAQTPAQRYLLAGARTPLTQTMIAVLRNDVLNLANGDQLDVVDNSVDALVQVSDGYYAAIIIHDQLEGRASGLHLLRTLRSRGDRTPILMTTGTKKFSDMVTALNIGADAYMDAPLHALLLAEQLEAIKRRPAGYATNQIALGPNMTFDMTDLKLRDTTNTEIHLPNLERRVLGVLLLRTDRVVSKEQLIDHLYTTNKPKPKMFDVVVSRLRATLAPYIGGFELIETEREHGFIIRDNPDAAIRRHLKTLKSGKKTDLALTA